VLFLSNTDEEVVRFDITMQEMARMNKLNALQHLIGEHEHGFERKLALAVVEKVLKTGSE